jgi:hypothetical protein
MTTEAEKNAKCKCKHIFERRVSFFCAILGAVFVNQMCFKRGWGGVHDSSKTKGRVERDTKTN